MSAPIPSMKGEGDLCSCCRKERLIVVRGAVVCPVCDCIGQWPKKRSES